MRIGFDATPLRPGKSGIGYHVEYLIRALLATGELNEIILFSNREPLFDGTPPAGVRWPRRHLFPKRAIWMQFHLPLLVREEKPDLTHYVNFHAPLLTSAPFVVTFHDLSVFHHPEFFTWKKRVLSRRMMPILARRALAIITVSETVRGEIIETLRVPGDRIFVVPAAPGDIFEPVVDTGGLASALARHGITGPYILFVGTLEPRKNLDGLMRAFDLLKNETKLPHRLVVVGGRGWKYAPIYRTVEMVAHREAVQFLDYVSLEELPALYAGADLLVFPSFYEGFGVPPLEAMRCGAPAVVSDIPVMREVVGEAAVFVDPRDTKAIAEGMRGVLEDPSLASRLRQLGFERGRLYTWERSAREMIAIYKRLLAERRRTRR
jgi:glycosyltransferase involved in cell wall biosynthesis